MSRPAVSLVCSVLNELDAIDRLLDSMLSQTRCPDEIVIVDGGSRDGTQEVVRRRAAEQPIRLIELPGSNISRARNAGIAATASPIVAVTDCGVRLEAEWLERLVAPLERTDGPDVVGGFFAADPRGAFETALGATTLIGLDEVDPERFLPSSRSVAFRRDAWQAVGGYPEWLDHSEDVYFDLQLQGHGFRIVFEPGALVHFRPRGSLGAFFRQYRAYARGDGRADLWRRRHALRYAAYLGAPIVLGLAGRRRARLLLAGAVLGSAYLYRPYRRLARWLPPMALMDRAAAVAWVPIIRVVGDVAKMLGYPAGVRGRI